ncbi:hypothetical protein MMC34_005135 [Xylographa carneopallida]|nr:hypothetical protein [Xylographa carneopallida]
MKLSVVAAFVASFSLSIACAGPGPCHDGPYRPNYAGLNTLNNNLNLGSNLMQAKPVMSNKTPVTAKKPVQKVFRRGLDAYEYTVHNPRDAVLRSRGYYDDDVDLGSLYARDSEFDDELLYGRDVEEYDLLDLDIRDLDEEYVTLRMNGDGLYHKNGAGGLRLPVGLDSSAPHVFFRLNTIPKAYPPFGSVDHAGLNKLMADLSGQHVDVVYGNPSTDYRECGLILVDMAWTKTHSNADGYPVVAQCRELYHGERDEYTYLGQYSGGSVEKICKTVHLSGLEHLSESKIADMYLQPKLFSVVEPMITGLFIAAPSSSNCFRLWDFGDKSSGFL